MSLFLCDIMQGMLETGAIKTLGSVIPINRPTLARSDLKSVLECMVQEDLSFGSVVVNYERELAKGLEFAYSVTTSSVTAAYHLVFEAIKELRKVNTGRILLPDSAPVAALDAAHLASLEVDLVDLSKNKLHPNPEKIVSQVQEKTLAVLFFYPYGIYYNYDEVRSYLKEKNILIIEDISYIAGTEEGNSLVGSQADVALLGLNDDMLMTLGKGAALLTDSKKLLAILKDLRTHSGSQNYRLRFDYTITDYQAALGIEQLGHLGSVLERRKKIGRYYVENLLRPNVPYLLLEKNPQTDAFTGFPVLFEGKREQAIKHFRQWRIATGKILRPAPLHHLLALPLEDFPNTERLVQKSLLLPLYPTLKKQALERVVTAVKTLSL